MAAERGSQSRPQAWPRREPSAAAYRRLLDGVRTETCFTEVPRIPYSLPYYVSLVRTFCHMLPYVATFRPHVPMKID